MYFFERTNVIHVGNIDHLQRHGHVTCDALRADGQLEVLRAVQAGFNLRDDGCAVIIDSVQRQSICIEQPANVIADLQHELINIFSFMNPVGHQLELPEVQRFKGNATILRRQLLGIKKLVFRVWTRGRIRHQTQNVASWTVHKSKTCPALNQRMS